MATGGLQDMMGGNEAMFGLISPYLMGEQQQPQEQTAFDMTPQQYLSQTPGDPNQPGRVDQNSFMGSQQQMNPLDLLTANIAKRFGG